MILDNSSDRRSGASALADMTRASDSETGERPGILDAMTSYVTPSGLDILQDVCEIGPAPVPHVRILYGEGGILTGPTGPGTVKIEDPDQPTLRLDEPTDLQALAVRQTAERAIRWLEDGGRSIDVRASNHHAKLYLVRAADETPTGALIGSMNLTGRGMGAHPRARTEAAIRLADPAGLNAAAEWFDERWHEAHDRKADLLRELKRITKPQSGETLYLKILLETYRRLLDEHAPSVDDDPDRREPERPHALVKRLHAFQREAAELIWRKLYRDDLPVVILADDVGLGKTYTALEVIRRATETGHTGALVLCPARLESMWRGFAGIRGERTTLDDPLTFSVVTHERIPHLLDQASAPQSFRRLDQSKIDLVVVDEAHAFKQERGMRATALRTWLSRGAARKVLLISATPVATSVADMLGEFAIGEAATGAGRFEQRVGHDWRGRISATAQTIERAARTGPVSRDTIVQAGLDNDLLGITGPLVIRRTRGMIRNRPDAGAGPVFPTAENLRETFKYLDKAERITYERAAKAVGELTFGHYDVLAAAAAPGRTTPGSAAGLRRTGLLKQLETCVKTAHDGLRRNLDELHAWLDWTTNGPRTGVPGGTAGTGDDDAIDDGTDWIDPVEAAVEPPKLRDWLRVPAPKALNMKMFRAEVKAEIDRTETALRTVGGNRAAGPDPADDPKLDWLIRTVRKRNAAGHKTLIFAGFRSAVRYLYEHLAGEIPGVAMIHGAYRRDSADAAPAGEHRQWNLPGPKPTSDVEILGAFAPKAQYRDDERRSGSGGGRIDTLIGTDCIGEGINLQDADCVIQYDLHWNPGRTRQRFGRVNRIGSPHERVTLVSCWPTDDLQGYLSLERRYVTRETTMEVEEATHEKEMTNLFDEGRGPDMAEPSDAGIMDALSLSDIIEELRELIGTRREEIEGLPFGLYAAVGREGGDAEIKACAFCFREITSEDPLDDPLDTTDPVTTIVVDGDNRAIAGRHPKDATAWLRTWAKGLQQPIRPLDDRLTQALQDGASDDSGVLHRMVRTALDTAKRHRQTQHQNACEQRGRRRPPTTRARIGADFELVGWVALYMT